MSTARPPSIHPFSGHTPGHAHWRIFWHSFAVNNLLSTCGVDGTASRDTKWVILSLHISTSNNYVFFSPWPTFIQKTQQVFNWWHSHTSRGCSSSFHVCKQELYQMQTDTCMYVAQPRQMVHTRTRTHMHTFILDANQQIRHEEATLVLSQHNRVEKKTIKVLASFISLLMSPLTFSPSCCPP